MRAKIITLQDDDEVRSRQSTVRSSGKVEFVDKPLRHDDRLGQKYYASAKVDDVNYNIGDCVMVWPDRRGIPSHIGKIIYFMEDRHNKMAHMQYFCYGKDTVLGELGDKKELFALDDCKNVLMFKIMSKVNISYCPAPENWSELGGTEEAIAVPSSGAHERSFWFRLKYEAKHARFTSVDPTEFFKKYDMQHIGECRLCNILRARSLEEEPIPRMEIRNANEYNKYEAFVLRGERFCVGDAAFVNPTAIRMRYEMPKHNNEPPKNAVLVDSELFPEYYRHNGNVKGSNEQTPDPFRIVVIESIMKKISGLVICVRKMYRPENTPMGESQRLAYYSDINEVFWSEDLEVIPAKHVAGKCFIRPKRVANFDPVAWHEGGNFRFFFDKQYDSKNETLQDVDDIVIRKYSNTARYPPNEGDNPEVKQRLRTLDVFAGCGGLSYGLEQSGIANPLWAIEHSEPAARAYQLNNKNTTVILDDCNRVLQQVMEGAKTNSEGKVLPQKGDVELMCGGPPCQGFSRMNRYSDGEFAKFKNSLISSYLSYCEYYRPKYFILENVMSFATFNKNLVLKLCLLALVKMGYQCTFGVLQAGNFGVPQTRRRCILMAAAPGQVLPKYPEPQHVFTKIFTALSISVDNSYFTTDARWTEISAPYRTITVRDALYDLPEVESGASREKRGYKMRPQSHFQRRMRTDRTTGGTMTVLQDHICLGFNPLINERMRHIPLEVGSDWRDLPNIVVRLSDGTFTDKMIYKYRQNGSTTPNAVCRCQDDDNFRSKRKSCDPQDHQSNTLIPWAMNHTGARNGNFAGLYGRISWDGFFSTTVTKPAPMGKQGRVLHPEQHRVVTVRECARSQGFPDSFQFAGTILEKHMQIGNAVPPTMGEAIGMEIRKALAKGSGVVEEVELLDAQAEGSVVEEVEVLELD